MKNIKCLNFKFYQKKFEFLCIISDTQKNIKEYNIYFNFNYEFIPSNEIISSILIRLFNIKNIYNDIYIDLEINKQFYIFFTESGYKCKFKNISNNISQELDDQILLLFTGGFDSLALKYLLPQGSYKLAFVNFDGKWLWSSREKNFASRFTPYTVSTNLLSAIGFNNVTFGQGIALLFTQFLMTKYFTMGDIIETGRAIYTKKKFNIERFNPIIHQIFFTHGLTQFSTCSILQKTNPNLIIESFFSSCDIGTEKYTRKTAILTATKKLLNSNIKLPDIDVKKIKKISFFSRYSNALILLYCIKFLSKDFALQYYDEIPNIAIDICNNFKLNFLNRYNTNMFNGIPNIYKFDFIKKISDFDILPYNENDFFELNIITNKILSVLR